MGGRPILVLTPFSEQGNFNNQLVKAVSEDPEMQQILIGNLLETVREQGWMWILNTFFPRTGKAMRIHEPGGIPGFRSPGPKDLRGTKGPVLRGHGLRTPWGKRGSGIFDDL